MQSNVVSLLLTLLLGAIVFCALAVFAMLAVDRFSHRLSSLRGRLHHLAFAGFVMFAGLMVLRHGHIIYYGQIFIGGRQAVLLGILMIAWALYILFLVVSAARKEWLRRLADDPLTDAK